MKFEIFISYDGDSLNSPYIFAQERNGNDYSGDLVYHDDHHPYDTSSSQFIVEQLADKTRDYKIVNYYDIGDHYKKYVKSMTNSVNVSTIITNSLDYNSIDLEIFFRFRDHYDTYQGIDNTEFDVYFSLRNNFISSYDFYIKIGDTGEGFPNCPIIQYNSPTGIGLSHHSIFNSFLIPSFNSYNITESSKQLDFYIIAQDDEQHIVKNEYNSDVFTITNSIHNSSIIFDYTFRFYENCDDYPNRLLNSLPFSILYNSIYNTSFLFYQNSEFYDRNSYDVLYQSHRYQTISSNGEIEDVPHLLTWYWHENSSNPTNIYTYSSTIRVHNDMEQISNINSHHWLLRFNEESPYANINSIKINISFYNLRDLNCIFLAESTGITHSYQYKHKFTTNSEESSIDFDNEFDNQIINPIKLKILHKDFENSPTQYENISFNGLTQLKDFNDITFDYTLDFDNVRPGDSLQSLPWVIFLG